ncbi:efflux RND transporter periplasmic adaptor subunit [Saccharicrinis fermentans]|uniref:Multidrug efflux system subunit MdtA n=1 Tax=Saccharicrinis fermentans DSM 9555 = JCM 21142 TaxID=869213 RepID=W7YNB0_9BACT|nr:efflux RND transporter periplasmic adaptor subunit [Saccharicrinis fermentans]GAF03924.1 multidrug efflux system subunit MdtA [Saccharicrinis fermentans DSM 9555 = JCM 21142]
MSRRKITFVVVALVLLLGGSYLLSNLFISMKPDSKRKPDFNIKRFVKADTVRYTQITSPLSAQGRVVSSNEVMLVSEAAGKIQRGNVDLRKGTSFKKGQLLAEIYKDEVELALKAKKSQFLTTITTILPDMKVDYPDQYQAYLDFFNAIEMEKALPPLPPISNSQLKVFLASRNFMSAYYEILQDEKKLSRHSLYAPFDGTFSQVNFEVGGYVNTGAQIAKMIRTDQVEVEVPVQKEQSKWIKIGDQVEVFNTNKQRAHKGVVVRKSDFIDANTQSRSIFIKVPNTDIDELLAGEYKIVQFPGQQINQAMLLPRNAVFNANEVFTVVEGKLKKRQINILKWDETTLIFNGLEAGQMIVSEPLINVKENSPVGIIGIDKPNNTPASKKENKGVEGKQNKGAQS